MSRTISKNENSCSARDNGARHSTNRCFRLKITLILLITAAVLETAVCEAAYHAVICGISEYEDEYVLDLMYCDDDAEDLNSYLQSYSSGWEGANIELLTDSAATKYQIRSAIERMGNRVCPGDVCIFFFSGHGTTDYFGYECLVAHDYDPLFETGLISGDELGDWMADLPTDNYIVFLDACHSGAFAKSISGMRIKGFGSRVAKEGNGFVDVFKDRIVAKDLSDNGCGVVVTACDEYPEVSYESDEFQHGVFSKFLLDAIKERNADTDTYGNNNGRVSAEECYYYIRPRAIWYTEQYAPTVQNAQILDMHVGHLEFDGNGLVIVTSPMCRSVWERDKTYTIRWSRTPYPTDMVDIALTKGDGWWPIVRTEDDGSYNWTVPPFLEPDCGYWVRVQSTLDPASCYGESSTFCITAPCSITVTSPDGDGYDLGDNLPIRWYSSETSGEVKIELYKGGIFERIIDPDTDDDGVYDWPIPIDGSLIGGDNYQVKVTDVSNSSCDGDSAYFCINCCSITVTSPDGDCWEVGEVYDINWVSENTSGNVKIDLYKGGSFDRVITLSTPDTGSYAWSVPVDGSLTGDCDYRIKVTDVSSSSCDGNSADFCIATPPVAHEGSVTTAVDTPVMITLQATDEGCPDPPAALNYIITSLPIHGELNDPCAGLITDPNTSLLDYGNQVEYIPYVGYEGQDSFTFKANDSGSSPGGGDSNEATVTINVKPCTFFDDFPSTVLDIDNWPYTSGMPTVDDTAGYEPNGPSPYSLHLENTDSVTSRIIDLSGSRSAQLHYYWKRVSTESGDDLYVEYWDGNLWQPLQVLPGGTNTGWEPNSVELPEGALHSEFRLRFQADCDTSSGDWYIDDVCLQPQSCMDHPFLHPEPDTTKGLCNTIYWNPVADANAYYAECANDANFINIIADSGWITDTNYEFCSLENGQIYWYCVKAWVPYPIETWLQTSQQDFETDTLIDTTATTEGDVVLAKAGSTEDIVGGPNSTIPDTDIGYFNGFLVTTDTTLTEIEVYLDIPASRTIEFVVYEGGTSFNDPYCRIHSSTLDESGTGEKFYSSGSISVSLEADTHYMIGAVWSNYVTAYCNTTHSSPSFADHTGWGYYDGFPSPDCLPGSNIISGASTLYHRYTISKEGYSKTGSIVSTAIELPVNCNWNWKVVDFNTTTIPAVTELTVDILPAAGSTAIPGYKNVSSGADLNGIGDSTIRLRANLSTADTNNTPALHDWSVSYDRSYVSNCSNIESSRQCNTPGDFEPDCDVDGADLRVLCNQWLLEELSADVGPDKGDGFVNLLDWAIFADGWQTTNDMYDLAEFAEQWLKTGSNYYIADIAPGSGDGVVNLLDLAALAENWLLDLTCTVEN